MQTYELRRNAKKLENLRRKRESQEKETNEHQTRQEHSPEHNYTKDKMKETPRHPEANENEEEILSATASKYKRHAIFFCARWKQAEHFNVPL